jgi:hypothetical protein
MAIKRMCSAVRIDGDVGVFFDRDKFNRLDDLIDKAWMYCDESRMSDKLAQDLCDMFDDFRVARTWVNDPAGWDVKNYKGE